ncbi:MAG: SusC/RagA family TonB-linked outer membrane protein [Dysgonamonadaceae bacterium]|jgi:TonB-linked SusC/RagA family outer membrane protein|nr:SusC/RagA family TonB-linked outer membrane protein [Dysgonamonadaceae bacterium]
MKKFSVKNYLLFLCMLPVFGVCSISRSSGNPLQANTVTGIVSDAGSGEPLSGATVSVKGTTHGTMTDLNGQYAVTVESEQAILVFSFVGYNETEMEVGSLRVINVEMQEKAQEIGEVVVTALGIKRSKKSQGYAVQSINGESLTVGNDANLMNQLTAKIAGVKTLSGNSGAGSSVLMAIRGESSFSYNQPLYIVDGVPVNNNVYSNFSGTQEIDYGNGAGELSGYDIENISVLKGANASALYGSRAANGVVLITTKTGKSKNRMSIEFNSTTTFENVSRLPKYQNEYSQGLGDNFEYWDGNNGKGTQDHQDMSWGRALDGTPVPQFDAPSVGADGITYRGGDVLARNGAAITPTPLVAHPDNVRDFFKTGVTYQNNISVSANNELGDLRISYTNLNTTGVLPNVDMKRNTVNVNAGYNFTKNLNIRANATYVKSESSNRPAVTYGPSDVMYQFAWFARQVNIESLKEYWQRGYEGTKPFHWNSGWNDNPYFTMYENTNGYDKNRMYGSVVLTYSFLNDFQIVARTGTDFSFDKRQSKRAYGTNGTPRGSYKLENVFNQETNSELLLRYDRTVNDDWRVELLGGGSTMSRKDMYHSGFANGLLVPGAYNLGNSESNVVVTDRTSNRKSNSLLFSGQLAWREKIFLNVTARNDWSSTLTLSDGTGDNSYFYPSVSLSAVLSDMIELPQIVSYWSVRGGQARVGNDTEPYRLESTYSYSSSPYGSSYGVSLPGTLSNNKLKPERLTSYEFGTDIRLLNNRVGLDLTYYNTFNENQIISIPVSSGSGYASKYINAGKIRNCGVEAILSVAPVRIQNGFKWDMNFNFTANAGNIVEINDEYDEYIYSWNAIYTDAHARVYAIARRGEAMGNIYGTDVQRTDKGEIIVNAAGTVPEGGNPELVKLGNYNPDFMLGILNKFTYRGFSLDFLVDWRQGGVFVSRTFGMCMESGTLDKTANRNPEDMVIDGVMWDNESGVYVKNTRQISARDYYRSLYRRYHETQMTFDATFVKLREVKMGYTVPRPLFNNAIKRADISIVGRNLWMWTKDQDYVDPESFAWQGTSITPGVEEMAYPSVRSVGININLTF